MNKLYQQLQGQQMQNPSYSPNLNSIKQMINMFRGTSNPQQLLTNMINQNPQVRNIMNLVNQSGKNPKQLFYELAKQKGVNPEDILRQLQ